METELEILKKILKNKKSAYVRLISVQTGLGADYVRYICKNLQRKNLIKKQGRDEYSINHAGEKELEKRGLIKTKGIFQSSQTGCPAFAKLALWKPKEIKVGTTPVVRAKIEKKLNFPELKEEKLTIGKKVEKAVSFLKKLKGKEGF
ncbi:MAG: hypothetical protein WBC21_01255 [Minisyncoccales bacterium]